MKLVTTLAIATLMTGCVNLDYLDNAVNTYCATDPVNRAAVRASVNADIAPHKVEITCAGDTGAVPN